MGTLINVVAIIGGGLIGLVAGKLINERFQKTISLAMGLGIIALAVSGFVAEMLSISQSSTGSGSTL